MPQLQPFDPLYELLAKANPNPDRVGCLPDDEIRAIAREQRPLTDPGFSHLTRCFPCYRLFGQCRSEVLRAAKRRRAMFAIAAAVVISLAGLLWIVRSRTAPLPVITKSPERQAPVETARAALVDLRRFSVTRSDTAKGGPVRVVLLRGRVAATVYLPVGSEPGVYDLHILTPALVLAFESKAKAEIRAGLTTISAELDLSGLRPGPYQLALRVGGQDWRLYPIQIE